jgi:hypothetical protein
MASLCALESLSSASAAAIFPVRGSDGCSSRSDARRIFEEASASAGPGGQARLVADGASRPGPGGGNVFEALSLAAQARISRQQGGVKIAYLCSPEEALARSGAGPARLVSTGYLPRWTRGAVELFLAECGLDPDLAEGVMERTGGWDALVISEAHALAGRSFEPLDPEKDQNVAPEELAGFMGDLRVIGPVTVPEAASLYTGVNAQGQAEIRSYMGLLAGLTVIVPTGVRAGETVWALDPRFARERA